MIISVLAETMKLDQVNHSGTSTQSMKVMSKFRSQSSIKWTLDSMLDHFNKPHNQDVTDAAGFIATTPDPDTYLPNP
jgi:hypothetical protein